MYLSLNKKTSVNMLTVSETTKVEEALMIMKNHGLQHLLVVNSENKIVSLVSDRELYKNLNCDEIEIGDLVSNTIKFTK